MRRLIAHHNNYYVVGLCDRAFLVFGSTEATVIELLPSSGSKMAEQSLSTRPTNVLPSDPLPDPKSSNHKNQKPHGRRKSTEKHLDEICAVAVINDNLALTQCCSETVILRCAVARNDKSLDIYTVKLKGLVQTTSQSPSLHYRTSKRVSCFTFGNIDAAVGESSLISTKMPVLISGDVAGDSYAYNLLEKGQQLLLGHTASMLTDISILNGDESKSDETCVITSDRDEKIRISRFPETYVIKGFLLGHKAYVTGVAIIPSPSPLIVSCGGDMTMRLWDLSTQKELFCKSTACSGSVATDGGVSNKENTNEIPTSISISSCGHAVALTFDNSKRLSIYRIIETKMQGHNVNEKYIELVGSIDCPSQPLSIVFHGVKSGNSLTVLMKEPYYIATYDIAYDGQDGVKPITLSQNESRFVQALRAVGLKEKIVMPSTILEKDDYGNPVLQKEKETRGPAASEAPWNRVERIEIAKEREKRRKKKPKLANKC